MPLWTSTSNSVHLAIRIFSIAYITGVFSWAIYRYYNDRRRGGRRDDVFKRVDGDVNEEEEIEVNINPFPNREIGLEVESSSESITDDSAGVDEVYSDENEDSTNENRNHVLDIEDISPNREQNKTVSSNVDRIHINDRRASKKEPVDYDQFKDEQLTDRLRGDLSKQGYRLIESHSAVKICRWTKNSMRGRGGCYKHTFYGIMSFQCMEMTPNLACASKCTFCWRHHKNPVGTEWKWKMDPPDIIVEQGIKNHLEMIRQLKGVPGVTKERFEEAQTIRHCALSLVGEPIFYPRINELLEILHSRNISTFLVTNAQFPAAMRNLTPVTQLYVSIDAPNKAALKKIDRPLYKDFWERYIECLEIIRARKQRTVFRLTLVQQANMEDLTGYAKLVDIGQPDFIEIKGVTYCGTSKANKLTMANVPWHEQVVDFSKQLLTVLNTTLGSGSANLYELACEHSHSNCVLLANKKFKINGKWHTWINYDKFFELLRDDRGERDFDGLDYAAETPSWAIFGSHEGGFDPEHIRWVRKDHKLKLLNERLAKESPAKSKTS